VSTLIVPTPAVQAELSGPGLAVLEKPVTIATPGVTLPDGTPLTDQITGITAGFFLFRRKASTVTEVWDETLKSWRVLTDSVVMTLKPKPLAYKKDSGGWEGLFVASADKNVEAVSIAGSTDYLFRTFFQAPWAGSTLAAMSAPTPALRFVAMIDAAQAGLKIDPPDAATEVTLFLRNSAKQIIGSLRLVSELGTAKIELSNTAGAMVRLTSTGNIELETVSGGHLLFNGTLVA
jgi:hypothetical protein